MTSLDTLALYKRVLLLVDSPKLQRTFNVVLEEEISALAKSVSDVVAAFTKVEEVRDAVNQLDKGKGSTGCSETVLAVMDGTMKLQQDLYDKLQKVASGIKVDDVEVKVKEMNLQKRKREEKYEMDKASSSDSSSSSSSIADSSSEEDDEDEDEEMENEHKKQKVSESSGPTDKKGSADLALAHEALSALSTMRPGSFESKDAWAQALFNLKLILNRQSSRDTTDKPTAEVTARALENAVLMFRNLVWTPECANEVRCLITALSCACSKNEVLRTYYHRVQAQLESLEMNKTAQASGEAKSATPVSARSLRDTAQLLQDLAQKVHIRPESEKAEHIIKALDVMQQVMADDRSYALKPVVRNYVEVVRRWVCELPFRDELGTEYKRFAGKFVEYGKNIHGHYNQVGWQRLATSLLQLVGERRKRSAEESG
ncbi:hypothetical protein, variant [Phytophthora nicotianae]|uniref:Uncharacterized protein n=1 Tax=Phytophthora nicotianae TaxID=4792 RepID=W2JFY7_PHYNI|nr:hypothetical protein L916_05071 [Phytophthora nicotianae]ETL44657.1 hypothetical protein, variant [Phytophthora nicotianae]